MIALQNLSVRQIIALVLVALLALIAIVQTWRIEAQPIALPFGMSIGFSGYKAENAQLKARLQAFIDARRDANEAAQQQKAEQEAANRQLAKETDDEITDQLETELDRAGRFARAGGLRSATCPRRPAATAANSGAGTAAPMHPAAQLDDADRLPSGQHVEAIGDIVSVLASDITIATRNTVLAEQCRAFVLQLEADSLAAQGGDR